MTTTNATLSEDAPNAPALTEHLDPGATDRLIPVIHGIEPAPTLVQATPKAVTATTKTDAALPQEHSIDLAAEVLTFLSDPAIGSPVSRS